jgi:putative redox protein
VGDDERLTVPGATGETLACVLRRPPGATPPRGAVLLAHCFTCGKDLHTMTRLASALSAAGWAVLRFDFTGVGESGGDPVDWTVGTTVGDVVATARLLRERIAEGPLVLVGHSFGGSAVLLAASRPADPVRPDAVVVIGTGRAPAHLRDALGHRVAQAEADGLAMVEIGGRRVPLAGEFVRDLAAHADGSHVAEIRAPLLVMHALEDRTVPIGEGEALFAAARQPKSFVALPHANHLLSGRGAAARAADVMVAWLEATL